jgi:hypothetical protein
VAARINAIAANALIIVGLVGAENVAKQRDHGVIDDPTGSVA